MLPIPIAIVATALQEPDLTMLKLTETQKRIVDELKEAGYTVQSARRAKGNFWEFVALELRYPQAPDITLTFQEGDPAFFVKPHVTISRVLELPLPVEKAGSLAEDIKTKYGLSKATLAAHPRDPMRSRLTLERKDENSFTQTGQVVRQVALLRTIALEPASTPDPLAESLKAAGLSFTESARFYQVVFNDSATKRKQTVWVRKTGETYGTLSVREAFSLCYDAKEKPDAALLQKAFLTRFTLGGLVLEAPSENQENWRIRYRLEIPADTSPDRLAQRLRILQSGGDMLEQELNPATEDRL